MSCFCLLAFFAYCQNNLISQKICENFVIRNFGIRETRWWKALYLFYFFHFKVGRMRRRVILMETVESRQDVLHEFAQRSKEFVKTSVEWAPDTVQSHLQVHTITTLSTTYISNLNFPPKSSREFDEILN